MLVPHKHAAIIKAWADGACIEVRHTPDGMWRRGTNPAWSVHNEYRVKVDQKPDITLWAKMDAKAGSQTLFLTEIKTPMDNVRLTVDGETNLLKAVTLLDKDNRYIPLVV